MPKTPGRAFQKEPGQPYKPFAQNLSQPLSAPFNIRVAALTVTSGSISWEPPIFSGGQTITGYRVARDGTDSGGYGAFSTVVPASDRSYVFGGLTPTTYALTVRAVTTQGDGPFGGEQLVMGGNTGNPGQIDNGGHSPANPTVNQVGKIPTHTWAQSLLCEMNTRAEVDAVFNVNRDAWYPASGSQVDAGAVLEIPPGPEAFEVSNSVAYLRTRRKAGLARPFVGAMLTTSRQTTAWTPGQPKPPAKWITEENATYFVEARLWCGRAKGNWNAFWLLGDTYTGDPLDVHGNPTTQTTYVQHWDGATSAPTPSAGWPTGGEVDILEFPDNNVGDVDKPYVSLHWARTHNETSTPPFPGHWLYREFMGHPDSYPVARPDLRNSWHTWGCYRSPFLMVFFVDGIELCRFHRFQGGTDAAPATSGVRRAYTAWDGPHIPASVSWTKPMFIFLNNAVDQPQPNAAWAGQGFTSYDQFEEGEMRIAYVKAWKAAAV